MPSEPEGILLIEDSDEDADVLHWVFRDLAFDQPVRRCQNGDDALDMLRPEDGGVGPPARPALIVLDLNLPGASGFEILARIKSQPSTRSIPVVIFTTSGDPLDVREAYALGASGYLQKPVDLLRLRAMWQATLGYWFSTVRLPGPQHSTGTPP